jgi:hypothetical protein
MAKGMEGTVIPSYIRKGGTAMKKSVYFIMFALFLIFSFLTAQSLAREMIYEMRGEITAIDLAYDTVVIEVPLAGKTFTVGGPLAPDAVVKRNDKPAQLSDFRIGEWVTVKWKTTEKGHLILFLRAK